MACIKTSLLNDASKPMCEQKGRAGAGKWANLVSPRCVTLVLPANHVELLATVLHARMRRLLQPCHCFQAPTDPRAMMKALAFSRPGARRKVWCASHLHVESARRHSQRVAASPAIRSAAISIVHKRRSQETPENGAHDRTGADTRVSVHERRQAGDTVPPVHPEWRWACAVIGTALQSAATSSCIFFLVLNPHS